MIATARLMRPLPVRPVDGPLGAGRSAEPVRAGHRHDSFHPTTLDQFDRGLVQAIRMTTRGGMKPLPFPTDPTA